MDATHSREQLSSQLEDHSEQWIFLKYYTEKDYFLSPEGILKVLSAIVCIVSSVLFLSGGTCAGAPALVRAAAAVALACAAASALLYAGVLLRLPLCAPQAYLFADIIISTVMGILLLVIAVLSMTVCEFTSIISYMHGPLAVINAGMVTASAVITYASAMRLWDAARPPREPPRPAPAELDV
ncbi:unnamed protein product [Chrysodeixis includens]|uniref:MARVEL domain-containing protein n=1 Tax=Chrysodeixis includens TaxID=689277 RepID=A0A9P0BKB4_CHRIL|nr:unnamed protein product [Chrysodeixis includens]